jgi:hypothetical protein
VDPRKPTISPHSSCPGAHDLARFAHKTEWPFRLNQVADNLVDPALPAQRGAGLKMHEDRGPAARFIASSASARADRRIPVRLPSVEYPTEVASQLSLQHAVVFAELRRLPPPQLARGSVGGEVLPSTACRARGPREPSRSILRASFPPPFSPASPPASDRPAPLDAESWRRSPVRVEQLLLRRAQSTRFAALKAGDRGSRWLRARLQLLLVLLAQRSFCSVCYAHRPARA